MKAFPFLLIPLLLGACSTGGELAQSEAAEAASAPSWNRGAMVAAANPHATDAAIEMLKNGGHAVDAAIAAHAMLGLVEPQSSGIGGGAFMLVYENQNQSLVFHDGREEAPAGATADMFMRDGKVMGFLEAWQSGVAVGTPGAVAMYAAAHKEHGKLPWAALFQPAIRLADEGFVVSPRLAGFLPRIAKLGQLAKNPDTAAYFFPGGEPLQVGDLRKNPEYADTLRRVAVEGPEAFYSGEIAEKIARAAQAPPNGGTLTTRDIANYRARRREAICGDFREEIICTTTPPSSGGAQIMMAGIYDHLSAGAANQADRVAAFVDAQRLAYADRDHFFGDPDAIDIPLEDLLDPAYIKHRADQRFAPGATPTHGDPGAFFKRQARADWSLDTTEEVPGTTHLSIIDGQGNAVALSATIEAPFGSSRWVEGFLLNNQMTDFAREVPADGKPVANAIAPGRRPRSSMSPTMIFSANGDIRMVTGSPGGNSIPAYVAKSIVGVLDWKLTAQQAVDHPNMVARGEKVRVEVSVEGGQAIADDLKSRGYKVQEREGENSGLHVIVVTPAGLEGAADKRREGTVRRISPES
jgi:gamma-glutamyltranspeptidase/glutathione hydrolase